jgi:23S rRNA (uracil1939-C5)-methyltransferase
MMVKNEERIGIVQALGSNGEGIIKEDGIVVFVPFALVGEKIRYKVLKVTSKCVYGKLLEVIIPAEIRVRPECPVFGKCGGCQLQHIRYQNQLKIKEDNIANCFRKIAGLDVVVSPTVKGNDRFRYRNKLQLPVSFNGKETIIGFYAEGSHRVVPIDDCLINPVWTKNIILAFKQYISEFNIKGYNEFDNSGDLREITVKDVKGKLIITLVVLDKNIRGIDSLIKIIEDTVKYPFSLFINVNTANTNVIYGDEFICVHGSKYYSNEMLGVKYKTGVQSFMQVNDQVCAKLYSAVRNALSADENTTVIDAYSGAGLMTAILAKTAKKAIGVEIVKEAVDIADKLAEQNNLADKITNYNGRCEDILPSLIEKEKKENSNVCIVLDPPRKGCDIKVLNAILKSDIDKIIYVSCLPSTLARDVGLLVGSLEVVNGEIKRATDPTYKYSVEFVKPFDMFSQTKHVETLIMLKKI